MAKTKAVAEQRETTEAASTQVELQSEAPIKCSQPRPTALARKAAFSPPAGSPPGTESADSFPATDMIGRARLTGGLQRSLGNARISHLYGGGVQAKLKVGAPNDAYEQEADRVADAVMRMPEGKRPPQKVAASLAAFPRIQHLCPECEEDERRLAEEPGEQKIQAKNTSGQSARAEAPPRLEAYLHSSRGAGQPLPNTARTLMEGRFEQDFREVRVHTDEGAARAAESVSARAFTSGQDIFFGHEEYSPRSSRGQRLLAHELTHVVQQSGVGETPSRVSTARNNRSIQRDDHEPERPLDGPLQEAEWELIERWQERGSVGLAGDLSSDLDHNALLVAEAIFCHRRALVSRASQELDDPLLCVEPSITHTDPRVRRLTHHVTEFGPIRNRSDTFIIARDADLVGPLTDEEWALVGQWIDNGRVAPTEALTDDHDANALIVAEAIFRRRMPLERQLSDQEDVLLFVDSDFTRADPRVRHLVQHVTGRGPITRETGRLPLHPARATVRDAPSWMMDFAQDTDWPVHRRVYEAEMASGRGIGLPGAPATWAEFIEQMGEMEFLGHRVVGHRLFLERLDRAQRYLRAHHPGIPLRTLVSGVGVPGERSQWRAAERLTASAHLFGMAIDINAGENPWMSNPEYPSRAHLYEMIIGRATWLVGHGTPVSPAESHRRAQARESSETIWRYFSEANSATQDYLSLTTDRSRVEALLEARARSGSMLPAEFGDELPAGVSLADLQANSVDAWMSVIQHDLDNWPNRHGSTVTGFINLRRELVIALRDYGGLQWGAADLGPTQSGDMMHFALDPPEFQRFRELVRRELRAEHGARSEAERTSVQAEEARRRTEMARRGREESE